MKIALAFQVAIEIAGGVEHIGGDVDIVVVELPDVELEEVVEELVVDVVVDVVVLGDALVAEEEEVDEELLLELLLLVESRGMLDPEGSTAKTAGAAEERFLSCTAVLVDLGACCAALPKGSCWARLLVLVLAAAAECSHSTSSSASAKACSHNCKTSS